MRLPIYKTADGCKAGYTKAQLLPEGRSVDGAAEFGDVGVFFEFDGGGLFDGEEDGVEEGVEFVEESVAEGGELGWGDDRGGGVGGEDAGGDGGGVHGRMYDLRFTIYDLAKLVRGVGSGCAGWAIRGEAGVWVGGEAAGGGFVYAEDDDCVEDEGEEDGDV